MITQRKFLSSTILRRFTAINRKDEKPTNTDPLVTNLDSYCLNPLLNSNLRRYNSLEETLEQLRKNEKALLRHVPHHAPLRQAYYTNILANRSKYTSRSEWILAVGISVIVIATGPERFSFF